MFSHAKTSDHRETRYVFHSTLVEEVAYGMLLDKQRRSAHLCAARMLSTSQTDTFENIARQHELGGSALGAAHWYLRACQRAKERGDSDTVLRCSAMALALGNESHEIELRMTKSDAFRFLGRREEQGQELERALATSASSREREKAMTEFAWNLSRTGNTPRALQMADAAVDAGQDAGDQECLALALGWRAVALGQLGRLDDALDALGEATQQQKALVHESKHSRRTDVRKYTVLAAIWLSVCSRSRTQRRSTQRLAMCDAQLERRATLRICITA
ncbi:MAG: hypothetical protein GY811_30605 [Myxococcales bacterium]|nr:hypothetical protein [Myxococcales bacterium]